MIVCRLRSGYSRTQRLYGSRPPATLDRGGKEWLAGGAASRSDAKDRSGPMGQKGDGMIRHIVALRFRAGTSDAVKVALFADLAGLQQRIAGVLGFHAGRNISVEPLSRGFDDVFWFDFRDAAVRDAYLVDPAHQAIGARIVALTEGGADGVFVFDVEMP